MKNFKTRLSGLVLLAPTIFEDDRGSFFESYNELAFKEFGIDVKFVQDNSSISNKNVIRGLHYQVGEFAQDKLVRVTSGVVVDCVVDVRPDSPTYGESEWFILSQYNYRMLFIPKGFAHGFESLVDNTIFNYKCSNFYNKEFEGGILYNDSSLDIPWNTNKPIVSAKDLSLPKFGEHKTI